MSAEVAGSPDPIDYMALVAATAAGSAYKPLVLRQLDLRPRHVLLDVGCGPGTDLAVMYTAVADTGLVVGVDVDHRTLMEAKGRTVDLAAVSVTASDAHSLPISDGHVDRVRTDRALRHMAEPGRVRTAFRRVLRPQGIAVLAEPDWGTLVIDCSQEATSRTFVDYICREVVRNALIGRQVARLACLAGFASSEVQVAPTVFRDFVTADKVLGFSRNAMRAHRYGYLTFDQAERWLASLRDGPMLASVNLFVTTLHCDA